jgi:vitamin K-dependent gamma-carboxylase
MASRIYKLLFSECDIASLVVYRVLFGVLMAWDAVKYVRLDLVHTYFLEQPMTFKYVGFTWVEVLPAPLMYGVFGLMALAAVGIAIGAYYRACALLYFVCHTYLFLAGAEHYLNHAYLISIIALLMAIVPAHRAASIDARGVSGLHSNKIHAWPYWLLIGTFTIVYVFGGLAKINADWLAGEPVRHWLAEEAPKAPAWIGASMREEWLVLATAYGGMVFDIVIPFLLIWRKTRVPAVIVSIAFHLTNNWLFNIGVFPWFMLISTCLFFERDWPRRLSTLGDRIAEVVDDWRKEDDDGAEPHTISDAGDKRIVWAMAAFFVLMILVPLRHWVYPGHVAWNEQGHRFAWRMMLRTKSGGYRLRVQDKATAEKWIVYPSKRVSYRQWDKSFGNPDMMLQYVHHVRDEYRERHQRDVAIFVDAFVELNFRPGRRFVDPNVDLAAQELSWWHYDWVLPFDNTQLPQP